MTQDGRPQRRSEWWFNDLIDPAETAVYLERLGAAGITRDYLYLEYKGEDRVYVPTDQFAKLSHVNIRIKFFRQCGEHRRNGPDHHCAPEGIDTFKVLRVRDNYQIAKANAQFLQRQRISLSRLDEFLSAHGDRLGIRCEENNCWGTAVWVCEGYRIQ